eukprot:GFUD01027344.1.p1 GENE.GFUD01027344.1~~GFUD01027344.1.p1  ORF type:complete len:366 (+),score=66.84 GFUD01027344.1:165-1262(+)
MAYAKTSIGRGCCKVSKKQKRISKLASFSFVLTEILVLATVLILPATDVVEIDKWLQMVIIIILSIHVLMQLWELKVFVKPDSGEKFSLTLQGSHERKKSRHRRTMYGVTVSDEVRVDYDRNSEGILVYFRKVTSSSKTGPYYQPFLLPFRGWFTFFHVIIALTLMICSIIIYVNYYAINEYPYLPVSEIGTHPLLLLLFVSLILQITVVVSSYYKCVGYDYTRWFKHTNAYTEMIQQNIQEKHGQHLQQEGEQLELAIRRNAQRSLVNDVTYHDVGPQTAKRYEDQIGLLHLLMAQEHDLACKLVFPEHSIQNKGVSFILTAEELETLNMHAEQAMETAGALKDDDTVTVIDTTELIANNTVTV